MANLKDVAQRAGVNPSTASRVLRDDPGQQVRPETRQRILDAARELRYRPNALAQGLRTRRTDTLGLIIPNLDNLGFADVTHGIQSAAATADKLVMVLEAEAAAGSTQGVYDRLIGSGRLDGLIVAFASVDDDLVAQLGEREIPLVLVNRRTSRVHGSVVVDDERGSRMAVEHLVGLGHRRIGYLGLNADTDTARRRLTGYGAGMTSAGIRIDPRWLAAGPPTEDGGRAAVATILKANPGRSTHRIVRGQPHECHRGTRGADGGRPVGARRYLAGELQRPSPGCPHGAAADDRSDAQLPDGSGGGQDAPGRVPGRAGP